jgi:hypothetical protein
MSASPAKGGGGVAVLGALLGTAMGSLATVAFFSASQDPVEERPAMVSTGTSPMKRSRATIATSPTKPAALIEMERAEAAALAAAEPADVILFENDTMNDSIAEGSIMYLDDSSLNESQMMVDHLNSVVDELRARLAAQAAELAGAELRAATVSAAASATLAAARAVAVARSAERAVEQLESIGALAELDTFEQKMKLMVEQAAAHADEAEAAAVVEEAEAVVAEASSSPVAPSASTPASLSVFAVPHCARNAIDASFADSPAADDDSEDSLAAVTPIARVARSGSADAVPSPSDSMTPATRQWYRDAFEPELGELKSIERSRSGSPGEGSECSPRTPNEMDSPAAARAAPFGASGAARCGAAPGSAGVGTPRAGGGARVPLRALAMQQKHQPASRKMLALHGRSRLAESL